MQKNTTSQPLLYSPSLLTSLPQHFPLDSASDDLKYNLMVRMSVGAFAGCFATVLTHPIDLIRAQVTIETTNKQGVNHYDKGSGISFSILTGLITRIKNIYQKEKLRGLYKGLGPTLLAISPFIAVQQSSYDWLKHKATGYGLQPSPLLFLTCGGLAGATAQTVMLSFNYYFIIPFPLSGCVSSRCH